MKRKILTAFVVALVIEIMTSWWVWQGQPSHGVVDIYEYSFLNYEAERILPWLIFAAIIFVAWALAARRSSKKPVS